LFSRPGGEALAEFRQAEKCFSGNISDLNREAGIGIDAETIGTGWRGETMDYSIAIDALLAARQREGAGAASGP
jgi:hypothetical protein